MYSYLNQNLYPYQSTISPTRPVEIPHVNGQNGAQAYQLPANSSILLLDDNAPIVYLVRTDSAGYKTITPYAIQEYKPEPAIDIRALLERVESLERRLNESDSEPTKTASASSSSGSIKNVNEYSADSREPTNSSTKHYSY